MLGKADVQHLPVVRYGLTDKGPGQGGKLLHAGHLPDHVISQPDVIQRPIQAWKSAVYFVKRRHESSSSPYF